MIVRPAEGWLYLITQPDHAALARRVMEHWGPLHDADRRASVLHAVGEHDNGWRELDDAPSADSAGRVYDFVHIPAPTRQAVWPRGVARLAADPWAAALVAHHAITVYERYRPDEQWAGFFPQLQHLRDLQVDAAGGTLEQLVSDYAYVRLGDLISLMFCTGWSQEQTFDRWTIHLDGDRVRVTSAAVPGSAESADPFEGREIPIAVAARLIPDAPVASDAVLRETLRLAPLVWLHGAVSGGL